MSATPMRPVRSWSSCRLRVQPLRPALPATPEAVGTAAVATVAAPSPYTTGTGRRHSVGLLVVACAMGAVVISVSGMVVFGRDDAPASEYAAAAVAPRDNEEPSSPESADIDADIAVPSLEPSSARLTAPAPPEPSAADIEIPPPAVNLDKLAPALDMFRKLQALRPPPAVAEAKDAPPAGNVAAAPPPANVPAPPPPAVQWPRPAEGIKGRLEAKRRSHLTDEQLRKQLQQTAEVSLDFVPDTIRDLLVTSRRIAGARPSRCARLSCSPPSRIGPDRNTIALSCKPSPC
jgi:hypothetical protein